MAKKLEYQPTGTCQLCESKPTKYIVGVIHAKKSKEHFGTGETCDDCTSNALKEIGKKAFGTHYWPIVKSLKGEILYNSYEWDSMGFSHSAGWDVAKQSLATEAT